VKHDGDLHYDRYPIENGYEWLMRVGSADNPPILVLPPLFEEMNRTRWLLAEIMRNLAGGGYSCWLPDLPGTGESERRLDECSWEDWRNAVAQAGAYIASVAKREPVCAAVRGGCLIDDAVPAACHWRFAPVAGASLERDLLRSSLAAPTDQAGEVMELAGYTVPQHLLVALRDAVPHSLLPLRTIRLASDRGDADAKTDGPALWRRSEPGTSPELADFLAADIGLWLQQCATS
jgi:pimeloyl-ACP methyl ester carboxylesterase